MIVNGAYNMTAGGGLGKLYINGQNVSGELPLPNKVNKIVIGNKLHGNWKVLNNPSYVDNMVGTIRIYARALDTHEINNNYYASAKKYGLELNRVSQYVQHGLVKRYNSEKNNIHYKMQSQPNVPSVPQMPSPHMPSVPQMPSVPPTQLVPQPGTNNISTMIQSQNNMQCHPVKIEEDGKIHRLDLMQPKQDVNANLLMLNSNPEEFMKLLQDKKTARNCDKVTRTVVYNNVRNNPNIHNFGSIMDNPFKSQVLVNYFKNNPRHFITVLNSNIFDVDQLAKLNEMLKQEDANHGRESFTNYDPNYHYALKLLSDRLRAKNVKKEM